jgi:phage terminase small subunit
MARGIVDPKSKLTQLQKLFIKHYCRDPLRNAAGALRKAGYKGKLIRQYADSLKKHPVIKNEISKILKETYNRKEIADDSKRILEEIKSIALMRTDQLLKQAEDGKISLKELGEMGIDTRLIGSVDIDDDGVVKKIRFVDKVKCLDMMAKYHKFYEDVIRETEIIRPLLYLPDNGKSSEAARGGIPSLLKKPERKENEE